MRPEGAEDLPEDVQDHPHDHLDCIFDDLYEENLHPKISPMDWKSRLRSNGDLSPIESRAAREEEKSEPLGLERE